MNPITKIVMSLPVGKEASKFYLKLKDGLYNEPCQYEMPSKILAISDIEGNFEAFLQLLVRNNVIDKYLKWTFGDGHLVIAGDCLDRGEQVIECLWLIYSLEEKARKKGGKVHFILGNHEIMNLNGDWRYVHPKYAKSSKIPYTALYYGNSELFQWLCTKNIVEKIGDILFVHGGISPKLLALRPTIDEINNLSRPWYSYTNSLFSDPLLHLVLNTDDSPFWYRGYYQNLISETEIDATLTHFGVSTIVTGHTIVEKIDSWFNKKVINLDTDHNSGNSEALFIRNTKFYTVNIKGGKQKIK